MNNMYTKVFKVLIGVKPNVSDIVVWKRSSHTDLSTIYNYKWKITSAISLFF